ncbi:MAG: tyrosine-type recombinase/integrase [Bacteroidaceae bacterium]|nr:tyrosine-type recombinase/integrase [Bacteroidaceae bacterium]
MVNAHSSVNDGERIAEGRKELLQKFFDYLRYERNVSDKTQIAYEADLLAFDEHVATNAPDVAWDTMDADVIRQWVVEMMDRGNKATSVNRRLSAVRSFYKFLLRRGFVKTDPAHYLTGPKNERVLPSYVRDSEMNRLLDGDFFPDSFEGLRDRTILLTLYSTGLRAAELLGLRLCDVDMDAMQLKVTGKRNKQRILPFGEEMKQNLTRYVTARDEFLRGKGLQQQALFVSVHRGTPMTYHQLRVMVKTYLSLATSATKKSPHTLRHTFATSMLNNQADLRSVKELLGHESLSTTEIYTHTSFSDLRNAYQHAHPRAFETKGEDEDREE